jgi:hypothetical protein
MVHEVVHPNEKLSIGGRRLSQESVGRLSNHTINPMVTVKLHEKENFISRILNDQSMLA